jgi:hypothetical protein
LTPVALGKLKTLENMFPQKKLKPKEGIIWKIPETNAKHDYNIS